MQHIRGKHRLERAEFITQRELVEAVALKIRHETPGEDVLRGERGRLRQLTALGEGFRVVRLADAPDGEAQHEGRRQDQNEKFFDFFFHTGLLKNGNTGRG